MEEITGLNILIAGVGGQGNVLAAKILGKVAVKHDQKVNVGETYGAAQRGGSVLSHVRIGKDVCGPLIPHCGGDVILGLEPLECLRQAIFYLKSEGQIICNSHPIYPIEVISKMAHYPSLETMVRLMKKVTENVRLLDATNLAGITGDALSLNMVMMGAFAASIHNPFLFRDFEEEVKSSSLSSANLYALRLGYEAFQI